MEKGYKKFMAWQKADNLAFQVYLVTKTFPRDERFGLTSQLRRAAMSVPTNIAEGTGRQGSGELKHFVSIALGSLSEVEYLLSFSKRLEYLTEEQFNGLELERQQVGNLLFGFYRSLRR